MMEENVITHLRGKRVNQYYMYIPDAQTEKFMFEMKKLNDNHNDDYVPRKCAGIGEPLNLWRVSVEEIERFVSGKVMNQLKFELFLEQFSGTIVKQLAPIKGQKGYRMILPLYPMEGRIEESRNEIKIISRNHSSLKRKIILNPTYVLFSEMIRPEEGGEKDIEMLKLGFRGIEEMIRRGAFDEIHIYGDRISPGIQKILIWAYYLHIPILIKGRKKSLSQSYAEFLSNPIEFEKD